MTGRLVEIVAGVLRDADGRVLTVRKRRTSAFMLPGGKREPGESDLEALARELAEEIGCHLIHTKALGLFEAPAANEPDTQVRGAIYLASVDGPIAAQAEIEEMLWIDPTAPPGVRLAPLLETHVLPRLGIGPTFPTG
ncbi:MAG: NUDIX domain-containing protein [Phenylobacterium sp.]|uniref:NUDIX hydrolase n=1 Tax=Phenylobacterium sp. TaxID=1871053 RepID=UPI002733AB97|nr:NUDIX domain-containing protein [Phenylobacterium sp.]MDP3747862.1 NUDIX domain-containing protein [Phenylobacterium sp.]